MMVEFVSIIPSEGMMCGPQEDILTGDILTQGVPSNFCCSTADFVVRLPRVHPHLMEVLHEVQCGRERGQRTHR
jgi:hypothetical protein